MKKNSPVYIFIFIVLISIVFGVAISAVHFLTLPMLKKNESLHRNRIIAQAFMLDVEEDTPDAYQNIIDKKIKTDTVQAGGETIEIFVHKNNGNVGFTFDGMGFWEPISGIVVLNSQLEEVVNLKVLEQKETPGLGARIEEQWFTDQFKGLNIKWQAGKEQRIIIGSTSNADKSNVADAITGASQTSMALMRMLNADLQKFRTISQRYRGL